MIIGTGAVNGAMELLECSAEYAVLHREDDLARNELRSDVDMVVDRHPYGVLWDMTRHTGPVRLISFYEYDVGAVSSFWIYAGQRSVAQLDMSYDPDGIGKYGLRTDRALRTAVPGTRWRRTSAEATEAYLASKRALKLGVSREDNLAINSAIAAFLTAERQRGLGMHLRDQTPRRDEIRVAAARSRRIWQRARLGIGFRVRVTGPAHLSDLQPLDSLRGYVPHVEHATNTADYIRLAVPLSRRPSLLVASSITTGPVHLDLRWSSEDQVASLTLRGMSDNALRQLTKVR